MILFLVAPFSMVKWSANERETSETSWPMRVLSPRDAIATKKMALSWRGESKYPCNIIVKTQRGNNRSEGDSRKNWRYHLSVRKTEDSLWQPLLNRGQIISSGHNFMGTMEPGGQQCETRAGENDYIVHIKNIILL